MAFLFEAFRALSQTGQNEKQAEKIAQGIREAVLGLKIDLPDVQPQRSVRFTQAGGIEVTYSVKAVSTPERSRLDSVAEKTRDAVNGVLEGHGVIGMEIARPASITNTINVASFFSGKPSEKHLIVHLGVPEGVS